MRNYFHFSLSALIFGMLVGGPFVYYRYRVKEYRNFRVVREGVLYRSGQLNPSGLQEVVHDHQIRTVVSLRFAENPADPPPDIAEENWCINAGLNFYRVRPRTWSAQEGWAPADASIRRFLQIMENPENYPVLVHCYAGCHRTGTYVAVYRMEFEHWSKAEALAEIRQFGSDVGGGWDVMEYLQQYQPRQWREVSAGAEEAEASFPRCERE